MLSCHRKSRELKKNSFNAIRANITADIEVFFPCIEKHPHVNEVFSNETFKQRTIDQSIIRLHCFTENLALGKPAWQLNPISKNYKYSANNSVDGRKSDLSELGGECTASSNSRTTAM